MNALYKRSIIDHMRQYHLQMEQCVVPQVNKIRCIVVPFLSFSFRSQFLYDILMIWNVANVELIQIKWCFFSQFHKKMIRKLKIKVKFQISFEIWRSKSNWLLICWLFYSSTTLIMTSVIFFLVVNLF